MSYKANFYTFVLMFVEFHKEYIIKDEASQFRGTPRDKKFKNSYNISWNNDKKFHEGGYMNLNDAIIKRIEEICKEKNINVCEASLNGGKSPSAIYDLIKGRTKCSKVSTIKAFCQGAGITLSEFFDKDYFNDFEE